MGVVHASVAAHIPLGATIGCITPCDALLTAGVSNWGGWGLVAAVEALVRLAVAQEDQAVAAAPLTEGRASCAGDAAVKQASDHIKGLALASSDRAAFERVAKAPPGCLLPSAASEGRLAKAMNAAGGTSFCYLAPHACDALTHFRCHCLQERRMASREPAMAAWTACR